LNPPIFISSELCLDQITDKDALDLQHQIGSEAVYKHLIQLPHPYELSDAMSFIRLVQDQKETNGKLTNWSIRLNNKIIGGIGQHLKYPEQPHKDEIGYWLGTNFWGQGIMTKVLKVYVNHLFAHTTLERLEAPVFKDNIASCKVLENCNFIKEGTLKHAYKKQNTLIDAYLYAKVKF